MAMQDVGYNDDDRAGRDTRLAQAVGPDRDTANGRQRRIEPNSFVDDRPGVDKPLDRTVCRTVEGVERLLGDSVASLV